MPLRGRVAALLVVAAGAVALVLAAVPAPAAAAGTTLTVIGGPVTVTRGGTPFPASSGELVRVGETVATGAGAHAVLTFVDGSTTSLSPTTAVVVEDATVRSGTVSVRLLQSVGLTWSSVGRLLAAGSRFEIRTPAATAAVRGTAFEVEVSPAGATRVRTAEGSVSVSNDRGSVVVGEGNETTADPGESPAPPAPAPPATRRTIEIGDRSVIVVDGAGRGCGVQEGRTVQQIPGCVVRDGTIEIQDVERVGEYRLAVTDEGAGGSTVVERTVPAEGGTVDRDLTLPAPDVSAPVPVAETGRQLEITLPVIGTIPVQVDLRTAVPAGQPLAPVASPTTGVEGPRLTLPPLPFPPPTPTVLPTLDASTPSPVATAVPNVTLPPATPVPTVSLEVATPTPTPTLPSAIPTVSVAPVQLSIAPSPTASPTPSPSPTPTPTPLVSITPLPTLCVPLGLQTCAP
jgi:hypothetical protein